MTNMYRKKSLLWLIINHYNLKKSEWLWKWFGSGIKLENPPQSQNNHFQWAINRKWRVVVSPLIVMPKYPDPFILKQPAKQQPTSQQHHLPPESADSSPPRHLPAPTPPNQNRSKAMLFFICRLSDNAWRIP